MFETAITRDMACEKSKQGRAYPTARYRTWLVRHRPEQHCVANPGRVLGPTASILRPAGPCRLRSRLNHRSRCRRLRPAGCSGARELQQHQRTAGRAGQIPRRAAALRMLRPRPFLLRRDRGDLPRMPGLVCYTAAQKTDSRDGYKASHY